MVNKSKGFDAATIGMVLCNKYFMVSRFKAFDKSVNRTLVKPYFSKAFQHLSIKTHNQCCVLYLHKICILILKKQGGIYVY